MHNCLRAGEASEKEGRKVSDGQAKRETKQDLWALILFATASKEKDASHEGGGMAEF